jgi:hypothetical protein
VFLKDSVARTAKKNEICTFLNFLTLEDGKDRFSRNVTDLPLNTTSYPRRPHISSTSRRKPQITLSKSILCCNTGLLVKVTLEPKTEPDRPNSRWNSQITSCTKENISKFKYLQTAKPIKGQKITQTVLQVSVYTEYEKNLSLPIHIYGRM